jgi:hypothetical protein
MKTTNTTITKKLFALACVASLIAYATGCTVDSDESEEEPVAKTEQAATSWWCYNGTCCAMSGDAVTRNCSFGCGTLAAGELSNTLKSRACGTR